MHNTALKTLRLTTLAILICLTGSSFSLSNAFAQQTFTAAIHTLGGSGFSNGGAGMATDGVVFDNVIGQTFTAEETGSTV